MKLPLLLSTARRLGLAFVLPLLALLAGRAARAQAPTITSFAPASGPLGQTVTVTGTNLTGLSSALVGGVPAPFAVSSATTATLTVPRGATNQRLRVSKAAGTALSTTAFQVTRPSTSAVFAVVGDLTTDGSTAINAGLTARPTVTDLDRDGRLDLLVGNIDGNVRRYEQTTANGGVFADAGLLTTTGGANLSVGSYAVPTVTDLDGDGLLDLLVGNIAGNVQRFEQTTVNGSVFTDGGLLTTDGSTALDAGNNAMPTVADLDDDGLLDLLMGGGVVLRRYEQTTVGGSVFALLSNPTSGPPSTSIPMGGGLATFSLSDFDGNGLLDLLMGNSNGSMQRYEQTTPGSDQLANLGRLTTDGSTVLAAGSRAAPTLTDVDGDGLLDLLVGNANGQVLRYEQAQSPTLTSFAPASGPLGQTVTVTGTNLTGLSSALVGGVPATCAASSATTATLVVPRGAVNQRLWIGTPAGAALSATAFQVTRPSLSTVLAPVADLTTDGSTALDAGDLATPTATDVDHDGLLDLLVGNSNGQVLRYEQTTLNDPTFALVGPLTTDGSTVLDAGDNAAPTVTDVDGNGRLDLLVGRGSGTVVRYEQTLANGPSFAFVGALSANGSGASLDAGDNSAPAVADLDNDGRLDLLVGNLDGQVLRYEQTTFNGPNFALVGPLTTDGSTALDVGSNALPTVTDFDGDGLLDLLVGNLDGQVLRYEQTTLNGPDFALVGPLTTDGSTVLDVGDNAAPAVTDVDGDGRLDLLVGNLAGLVPRYEQAPPAPTITSFSPASGPVGTSVTITGTNLTGATTARVNGTAGTIQGTPTATSLTFTVGAGSTTGAVSVTTPGGTATSGTSFTVTVPLTISALSPTRNQRNAAAGSSVAITFSSTMSSAAATLGAVKVFSQQRGGRMQNGARGVATVSGSTVTFNPTNDFRPGETVFATVTTAAASTGGRTLARGQVHQFTAATSGTGAGNFLAPATNADPAVGAGPNSVALGDVDGDGDLDFVVANYNSDNVSVRLNDGTGNLTGTANLGVGDGPFSVTLGDVDGDGDLDLLTANVSDNTVSVRRNSGTGSFTGTATVAVGDGPQSVALGDVDGDGDLDFLTANYTDGTVSVRLNDGMGTFTAPATNPELAVVGGSSSVVLGDVDGDGDLDFLVANYFGNNVSVRLNDGTGNFTAPATNADPAVGAGPNSVALGDLDGDGDLDFVVTNYGNDNVSVRLNDGTGNFTAPAANAAVSVGSRPPSVALGDLDGDGDLDLLAANVFGASVSVRLNDGTGSFTAPATNPDPAVGNEPYSVALGDLDGDGDLDFIVANYASNNVSVRLNQPPAPLPVELTAFAATRQGAAVALAWRTASEKNSARFEVERSADGQRFEQIGEVQAQGTKASPSTYTFLDDHLTPSPAHHPTYYRLRQVDLDGTASYSPVRAVALSGKATFTLYPNPAHGAATATGLPAGAAVTVLDALGRAVAQATADVRGTARLALPAGLAAGVYIVRSGAQARRLTVE